jgi:hypothetical protein
MKERKGINMCLYITIFMEISQGNYSDFWNSCPFSYRLLNGILTSVKVVSMSVSFLNVILFTSEPSGSAIAAVNEPPYNDSLNFTMEYDHAFIPQQAKMPE